jgi:uncharacterized coiled-coil protein SlyX
MFNAMARTLGTILALTVVAAIGGGLWVGYTTFYAKDRDLQRFAAEVAAQRETIAQLEDEVAEKARHIERLETALRLLKVERRVAYIDVLEQERKPGEDRVQTTFQFTEVDEHDQPLTEPRQFTIDGDLLYIDYWVIKFDDEAIEQEDPLRSTSIALFRRLFGEYQEPSQGFTIDQPGTRPAVYAAGTVMTAFQQELWDNFWHYATDAEKAREAGVRAAHGEAPSTRLVPNKRYKLLLRASGGFSIVPEDRVEPSGNST